MKFLVSLLVLLFTLLSIVIYIYLTTDIHVVPSFGDEDNSSQHEQNTTDPKELEERFLKEYFQANWEDIQEQLNQAIEKYIEIDEAGEPSFFWDKKASLWDELEAIFDEIIEDMKDGRIDEHQERMDEIKEIIQEDVVQIQAYEVDMKTAPKESYLSTTVLGYKEKIKALEEEIKIETKNIKYIEEQIHAYYYNLGVLLSQEEFQLLKNRIDFDFLYEAAIVMNMLQKAMGKVKKETMEHKYQLDKTLYYYNTSRIVFEFILYLQKRHQEMIDDKYIPNLNALLEQKINAYKEDTVKSKQAQEDRELYTDSLKAQKIFIETTKLYKKDILKQRKALWRVRLVTAKHLELTRNRYMRSKETSESLRPKRDMQKILDSVIRYYFDDIGSDVEDAKQKEKYQEITRQLRLYQ